MTIAQKRARARDLHNQAQALYAQHRDSEAGMPDEAATQYDTLLNQRDALLTQAEQAETLERRLNDAASRLGDQQDAGNGGLAAHTDPKNTRNGLHGFSVLKAMSEALAHRDGIGKLTGLEAEVHTDLSNAKLALTGRKARGVMIPLNLPAKAGEEQRTTGLVDTTAGTGALFTQVSTDLISILRSKMVTVGMGARVLSGMQGLFAIPRQNQAGTAYWVGEGTAPTTSNQTIDQVTFSPKTVGAFTDYTRRFLEQTSIDAENFIRSDLMEILSRGLELAGLYGTGMSNQPKGVGQYSTVGTVAIGDDGGPLSWAKIVEFETKVAVANADMGNLGYIFNAATRGKLKVTPKIGTTFPIYLWDSSSSATPVNGYPVGITNLLPSTLTKGDGTGLSLGLFGNWADLIYTLWSGVDVLIDPYTGSSSGNVRVVALQDADVNMRHPESFAKCVDIDNA